MSKVYIGVGHGGADPGAVGYLVEEDINLQMALACKKYLEAAGVETKISRETDKEVSVAEKVKQANEFGADLALDIHNNAGGGDGAEVFHSICYGEGKELADNILKELEAIGQNSRGAKTKKGANGDYYAFVRNTTMPAVITEGVFVDNKADAAQADTPAEQKAFGEAIAKGVLKTLDIEDKVTADPEPEAKKEEPKEEPKEEAKPEPKADSFLVKVTANALNIRAGAGTNFRVKGVIKDNGVYTIVETQGNWGRLKSGAGWICLDYTKKL